MLAQDADKAGHPYAGTVRGYTPVLFLSITACEKNAVVMVEWTTSEEHGIKYYQVEKSMDGVNFYPVATLPANNKLQVGNYSWADEKPWGSIIYYRVKAIDAAGKYFISPTKIVSLQSKPAFSIFPNPLAAAAFTLNINGDKREVYQLRLFNGSGQLMMEKIILHAGGFLSYSIQLPPGGTAAGFYIVKINGERGQCVNVKLVIAG